MKTMPSIALGFWSAKRCLANVTLCHFPAAGGSANSTSDNPFEGLHAGLFAGGERVVMDGKAYHQAYVN